MRFIDLIEKKTNGLALDTEEIRFVVNEYTDGSLPDYQMAAFLMSVVHKGMDERETADMTLAMMHSGDVIDLSSIPGTKVDKHSTGGVGDTTTLVIAPLVAACGGTVAKMSGRGLGHSGGTVDKLESIPGVQIEQSIDSFIQIVRKVGVAVVGQSGNLVPADKKIYALRDVTCTVRSVPLIASSVMSKKLAAGADAIVLDVKAGSGAFMRTVEEARELAHRMVDIGRLLERRVIAIITDMNQPLGCAVGNALEVKEAVEMLSGMIPQEDPFYRVCFLLASRMLLLGGIAESEAEANEKLKFALVSGAGLQKLRAMITELGGDASYLSPAGMLPLVKTKKVIPLYPMQDGYLTGMDTASIGIAAQLLGGGRTQKTDVIDPAVGLVMHKRLGDVMVQSEPYCTLYVNDERNLDEAIRHMAAAVVIGSEKPPHSPMVYDVIGD